MSMLHALSIMLPHQEARNLMILLGTCKYHIIFYRHRTLNCPVLAPIPRGAEKPAQNDRSFKRSNAFVLGGLNPDWKAKVKHSKSLNL